MEICINILDVDNRNAAKAACSAIAPGLPSEHIFMKTTRPQTLLIGSTGPLGIEILRQASEMGITLKAMARKASGAVPTGAHQSVIGDVLLPNTLEAAMSGVSTVVCVLGTPLTRDPVTLLSVGTENLVAAMKRAGASRLLCITGMGAGDSRGHGGFVYDHLILPYLLGEIYKDKDRQELIVKSSALDWSIIRPGRLTNGSRDMRYRELVDLKNQRMRSISRADVAHFVLRELKLAKYSGQTVNLTN